VHTSGRLVAMRFFIVCHLFGPMTPTSNNLFCFFLYLSVLCFNVASYFILFHLLSKSSDLYYINDVSSYVEDSLDVLVSDSVSSRNS